TNPSVRMIARIVQIGMPGMANSAIANAPASDVMTKVDRGGSRSANDIRVIAPANWANAGPNRLKADNNGDPVREKTSVASARPASVPPAIAVDTERKNARNSATEKS